MNGGPGVVTVCVGENGCAVYTYPVELEEAGELGVRALGGEFGRVPYVREHRQVFTLAETELALDFGRASLRRARQDARSIVEELGYTVQRVQVGSDEIELLWAGRYTFAVSPEGNVVLSTVRRLEEVAEDGEPLFDQRVFVFGDTKAALAWLKEEALGQPAEAS